MASMASQMEGVVALIQQLSDLNAEIIRLLSHVLPDGAAERRARDVEGRSTNRLPDTRPELGPSAWR